MRRSLRALRLPFHEPYVTAAGALHGRELLLVTLTDADGFEGSACAAPLEPYDGTSIDAVLAGLRGVAPEPPHARAALELARLDLEGRRAGRPLASGSAATIAVNRTLPAGPPEQVAERATEGVRAGYGCFKLKVGLPDDAERVAAARAALGPGPLLRLDANGAWNAGEAAERIAALARHDLELVEQPCRTLEEMAEVRRVVEVALAADEAIAGADDVERAAALGACDAVCVKLQASGGFEGARAAIRSAREHGLDPYLASTLEGPWGIAAALQLAAAEGITRHCGLATLELFDAELARVLPRPEAGELAVPSGPGTGVEVSAAAVAEVTVEELED